LRVARGRGQATTISAPGTAPPPSLGGQAQVTKEGTVIQKVGEHEIRDTSKGLHVEEHVGDDVLVELIARAIERYEGDLTAFGPAAFQLRIAGVAGANHLAVSFADPELEKARSAAQATALAPVNKAALEYIAERNSKRDRVTDIPFHRLWQTADAGDFTFVGLRVVAQQNLLIAGNGTEHLVLPITPFNGNTWRSTNAASR
jgi:Large polyvalent protein-associated domain 7